MSDEPIMDDEFEEISIDEVDRVITALDQLIQNVESETIRAYLETTAEEISYLVDSEEDEDESESAAA